MGLKIYNIRFIYYIYVYITVIIYVHYHKFLQLKVVFAMILTEVPWPCFHFNTSCMNNILLVAMRTFSGPLFLCLSSLLNHLLSETFITIGLWLLSSCLTCFLFWIDFTSTRARHIFSLWFPITDTIYNKILPLFSLSLMLVLLNHSSFFFPTCSFPFLNEHG